MTGKKSWRKKTQDVTVKYRRIQLDSIVMLCLQRGLCGQSKMNVGLTVSVHTRDATMHRLKIVINVKEIINRLR